MEGCHVPARAQPRLMVPPPRASSNAPLSTAQPRPSGGRVARNRPAQHRQRRQSPASPGVLSTPDSLHEIPLTRPPALVLVPAGFTGCYYNQIWSKKKKVHFLINYRLKLMVNVFRELLQYRSAYPPPLTPLFFPVLIAFKCQLGARAPQMRSGRLQPPSPFNI